MKKKPAKKVVKKTPVKKQEFSEELDLSCIEETIEPSIVKEDNIRKITEEEKVRSSVLFPGVLPGPFEPNEEVLQEGVVDLRALRSGLHLIILQAQAAIGAIECLEYTRNNVQKLNKKEAKG